MCCNLFSVIRTKVYNLLYVVMLNIPKYSTFAIAVTDET